MSPCCVSVLCTELSILLSPSIPVNQLNKTYRYALLSIILTNHSPVKTRMSYHTGVVLLGSRNEFKAAKAVHLFFSIDHTCANSSIVAGDRISACYSPL